MRRCFLPVAGSVALAFCPFEGGSDELSGVFGGVPSFASSSAMRASSALFWSSSSSIFDNSEPTSGFKLYLSDESMISGDMPLLESVRANAFNGASASQTDAEG